MKYSCLIILAATVLINLSMYVQAAPAVDVRVSLGKVSEIDLPEKVAKVVKGGASDSVLVEVLDNVVYVLPKTNSPAGIFVTGVSGASYPLNLIVAAEHDIRVQVGPSIKRTSQEIKQDTLKLMREMLLGQEPPGATVLKGDKSIQLKDERIQFTVEKVYDFPNVAAYILKARNLMDQETPMPIERISFPFLFAIAADEDILKPKGQQGDATKVYMVTGK